MATAKIVKCGPDKPIKGSSQGGKPVDFSGVKIGTNFTDTEGNEQRLVSKLIDEYGNILRVATESVSE